MGSMSLKLDNNVMLNAVGVHGPEAGCEKRKRNSGANWTKCRCVPRGESEVTGSNFCGHVGGEELGRCDEKKCRKADCGGFCEKDDNGYGELIL